MITPNNGTARVPGPLRSSPAAAGRLPRPMGLNLDPINWMRGHLTLKITLDMPVPATEPAPDYSQDEQHLRAWERADFSPHVRAFAICDRVMIKGIESSFVKEIQFTFIQSNFQYFVAKHIY